MRLRILLLWSVLIARTTDATKFFGVQEGLLLTSAEWEGRCKAKGGRLASINSAAEQEEAYAATETARTNTVLTGMRRIAPHKHFVNSDGKKLSYSNWKMDQPDYNGDEGACIRVNVTTGQWDDIPCKEEAALCEVEWPPLESYAAKDFEVLGGSRYALTVAQWQAQCKAKGGRLASINSLAEQRAALTITMKANVNNFMITGMRRIAPHEHFVNSDGQNISFSNWKPNQPDDYKDGEECIEIHARTAVWNDGVCKGKAAVCEFQILPGLDSDKHFVVLEEASRYFAVAQWEAKCEEDGGRLAFINSASEQRAVAKTVREGTVLFGMRRIAPHKQFVNSDGQNLSYSNWNTREPNDYGDGEECVQLNAMTGKWSDIPCAQRLRSALCEIKGDARPGREEILPWTLVGKTAAGSVDEKLRTWPRTTWRGRSYSDLPQHCFKSFVLTAYDTAPVLYLEVEEVATWSSWGPWQFSRNFSAEVRTRVCCAENCYGSSEETRGFNLTAPCDFFPKAFDAKRAALGGSLRVLSITSSGPVCAVALRGDRRTVAEMRAVCRTFGMALYSLANPKMTRDIFRNLAEDEEDLDGFLSGFVRTKDAFWSAMDGRIFALSDLADRSHVLYSGRAGVVTQRRRLWHLFNHVENCVRLVFPERGGRGVVGMAVQSCSGHQFVCHDMHLEINQATLARNYTPGKHCSRDEFGLTYFGDLSTSHRGNRCLPWRPFDRTRFQSAALLLLSPGLWFYPKAKKIELHVGAYRQNAPWVVVESSEIVPGQLGGTEGRCRNFPGPFMISTEPVCRVKGSYTAPQFEMCAVPVCARERGKEVPESAVESVTQVPVFSCSGTSVILNHGFTPYVSQRLFAEDPKCVSRFVTETVLNPLIAVVSAVLNLSLLVYLFSKGLVRNPRSILVSLFPFVSLLLVMTYVYGSLIYPYINRHLRVPCILYLQTLSFVTKLHIFATLCVAVDNTYAAVTPKNYHRVVTNERTLAIFTVMVLFFFAFAIVFPMIRFGLSGELLVQECYLLRMVPKDYIIASSLVDTVMLLPSLLLMLVVAKKLVTCKAVNEVEGVEEVEAEVPEGEDGLQERRMVIGRRLFMTFEQRKEIGRQLLLTFVNVASIVVLLLATLESVDNQIVFTIYFSFGIWNAIIIAADQSLRGIDKKE